jgi:typhasterol/6-deoxotyphasterol 2alpha-hydroxylase
VRRMRKPGRMFDAFMEYVIDEHAERRRSEGEGFVARDMVDVLMQLADEPTLEVQFGRVGVPHRRRHRELVRHRRVGHVGAPAEALRRRLGRRGARPRRRARPLGHGAGPAPVPVAPPLVPRVARDDASVFGYDIPKGARVFVNVWTIGRDPALWHAPEEFLPERFVGSKMDVKWQDLELLPLGSGRRMCPGYNLGLASLLHGFTWTLPEGMAKEELSMDMDEVFGLSTTRVFPLEVAVQPRLPVELYA